MTSILVVDDDSSILLNTTAYLEDEGYDVYAAKSAQEALILLEKEKIDLGIIDMRLPGIDGNELILELHKKDPLMKFIIHTGSTDYIIPDALIEIGIDNKHIVNKPVVDMKIFKEVISELLSSASQ